MAVESMMEQQTHQRSPEDWVEWFLHRLNQEPWALGGAVVIGVFLLATLSLVVFTLLYGCCCSSRKVAQKNTASRQDGVI